METGNCWNDVAKRSPGALIIIASLRLDADK